MADIFTYLNFALLILVVWRLLNMSPVDQATFDAALANLNTAFSTLLNSQQSVITGLGQVEAALIAAQTGNTSADFSAELAIVQNLQTEASAAQATATAAIASLPTPPAPPAT